ncbi:MAG: LCP family protein [Chloroflexi bacterium]|nr:LCP family protein [Chloroflexota bacterium]
MRGLGLAIAAALLIVVLAVVYAGIQLAQISTEPLSLSAPPGQQRVLILGYGGGDHPGAYLSDSMLLLVTGSGAQAEISVPRDLWVQLPPNSGQYAKINAALQMGYDSGGLSQGATLAALKVQQVTGLTPTGWVLEDFTGFRNMIDSLGGVDVNVQRTFSAQYPVNDNPNVDASWKIIHFDAGPQHMDGERALEFARARYADNPAEASDFARSQRQQLLIAAIRQKVASPAGAVRMLPLVGAVSGAVHTSLSGAELAGLLSSLQASGGKRISLDTDNVLVNGKSADGQDILLPRNGNYNLIVDYVRQQLAS